jgi:hypothetical protein
MFDSSGGPALAWYSFDSRTLYVEGEGPLSQEQVSSIWNCLPTTGCARIERGKLFIQQRDGAEILLGDVAAGVRFANP